MKKIIITAVFSWVLLNSSYAQKGYVETATIKGRGNAMDTIIKKKTELSFDKTFPNNYKRDENVVQTLQPYMVTNMIDPTKSSHLLYRAQVKEANRQLTLAKADIAQRMKASPTVKERMAQVNIYNEADLNAIKFMYLPMYCLTVNVVNFRNGENIAKYYTLGSGGSNYLMLRNNKLIGYLHYYPDNNFKKTAFFLARPREIEILDQLLRQGKTPIGFRRMVCTNPKLIGAASVDVFGYVEQGHVVFSYYTEGVTQQIGTHGYVAPNPRFYKYYTTETAESFFSGDGSRSVITSWLDATVDYLKKYPKKRQ